MQVFAKNCCYFCNSFNEYHLNIHVSTELIVFQFYGVLCFPWLSHQLDCRCGKMGSQCWGSGYVIHLCGSIPWPRGGDLVRFYNLFFSFPLSDHFLMFFPIRCRVRGGGIFASSLFAGLGVLLHSYGHLMATVVLVSFLFSCPRYFTIRGQNQYMRVGSLYRNTLHV